MFKGRSSLALILRALVGGRLTANWSGIVLIITDVEDGKKVVFACTICEVKYGINVECELLLDGYNARKYKRVDEFIDAHEKCEKVSRELIDFMARVNDEKVEVKTKYDHPLIDLAVELFQPQWVKVFPIME